MLALLSFLLLGAAASDSTEVEAALVQRAVLDYVAPHDPTPEAGLWRIAWADLNANGLDDALVFSRDADWCETRGCTLLVVEAMPIKDQKEVGPYVVAAEIGPVRAPIQLAEERSGGWCDVLVRDVSGATERFRFDGETYARGRASGVTPGALLFAAD